MSKHPVFDKTKPHGQLYGSDPIDGKTPRYYQNGHYFGPTGDYISSDSNARVAPQAAPVRNVPTDTAVTDDAELAQLLEHPLAADLVAADREIVVEMVKKSGGPVLSGEKSHEMMVAWLVKMALAEGASAENTSTDLIPSDQGEAGATGEGDQGE